MTVHGGCMHDDDDGEKQGLISSGTSVGKEFFTMIEGKRMEGKTNKRKAAIALSYDPAREYREIRSLSPSFPIPPLTRVSSDHDTC